MKYKMTDTIPSSRIAVSPISSYLACRSRYACIPDQHSLSHSHPRRRSPALNARPRASSAPCCAQACPWLSMHFQYQSMNGLAIHSLPIPQKKSMRENKAKRANAETIAKLPAGFSPKRKNLPAQFSPPIHGNFRTQGNKSASDVEPDSHELLSQNRPFPIPNSPKLESPPKQKQKQNKTPRQGKAEDRFPLPTLPRRRHASVRSLVPALSYGYFMSIGTYIDKR